MKKVLPKFNSEDEEREFWAKNDSTDFVGWDKAKECVFSNLRSKAESITIRLHEYNTIHIARSQARNLLNGLDKFKHIILDFDQVPTVGQAFADEIFRVFKIKHPEISIESLNMNETVAFMIGRVEKV